MKKISHKKKIYLINKSRAVIKQRTANSKKNSKPKETEEESTQKKARDRTCKAPEKFRVLEEKPREELFNFFYRIEEALDSGARVKIDFQDATELYPCGTLIFLARLDVWTHNFPNKLSCTYPKDDVVEQLLQHLNILQRLGLSPRKKVAHERVSYWHYHSGTNVNAATYQDLTESIISRIEHPTQELFADCLNEAVANTVNHAYRFETVGAPPKPQQKWWMLSQLRDGQLFVAIYDSGMGIPNSLKSKPEWKEFLKVRNYSDPRLIESAVASNRSSTRLPERGKGLPEMLEFSQELRVGGLSIWSGRGGFSFNVERSLERRTKFSNPLPGTLVLWEIPFRQEQ